MENLQIIILKKLCPLSLTFASTIPVLGRERVCPRKVGPWPQIFCESLALASNVARSTPPLINIFKRILLQLSNTLFSTHTLVTFLWPWITRFTIIIIAWWLRTRSKFIGQEPIESTGALGHCKLLSGFLQTRSSNRNKKCADYRTVSVRP